MRENIVPYVTSLVFAFGVAIIISAYGIFRQFFVKKTAFGVFDENGDAVNDFNGGHVPMDEFTANPTRQDDFADFQGQPGPEQTAAQVAPQAPAPAANPFKKDPNAAVTNPFNNQ
jgi:hypothetical protein